MSQLGAQLAYHVVRRSFEASADVDDSLEQQAQAWEKLDFDMPSWGGYLLAGTLIFFGLQFLKYHYTVGHVVSTLAMIEDPSSTLIIETKATETYTDSEPDATIEKAPLLDVEQTIQTIPTKPVTSKLRTTIKHITAQGGWRTRYRGLGVGILYMALRLWVATLLFAVIPTYGPLSHVLVAGLSALLTSPVHLVWTHSTISKPVNMSLAQYTRQHGRKTMWIAVLVPSFIAAVMAEASIQLTVTTRALIKDLVGDAADWTAVAGSLTVMVVFLFGTFFCMLPSLIVLKRVEASLLPKELETLVPFDRTFGGLLEQNHATDGTKPWVRGRAARRSLTKVQFRNVIKTYLKLFAIVCAIGFVAIHVVALEAYLIMGDALRTLMISAHAQLQQMQMEQNP